MSITRFSPRGKGKGVRGAGWAHIGWFLRHTRKGGLGLRSCLAAAAAHGASSAPPGRRLHESNSMVSPSTKMVVIPLCRRLGVLLRRSLCAAPTPVAVSHRATPSTEASNPFLVAFRGGVPSSPHGARIIWGTKEAMSRVHQGLHRGFTGSIWDG